MFQGSLVALVTPMHADGSIDKNALCDLIEWHIDSKTDGLVIAGSTGEAATLNATEKLDLITTVVKQVKHRVPVIAGTGSDSTREALELTKAVKTIGADACLIVTPYYNKPTQNGLYAHYKLIAETCDIPIILYNVPSRTACDLLPETVERLAVLPSIIGIKEATGNLERGQDILKRCPSHFRLYSGDDATAANLMLLGGHGVISVTANVAPASMSELCRAALAKNKMLAETINLKLSLLHKNLFLESNPISVKWALYKMGLIQSGIRLPLQILNEKFHDAVCAAMREAGISTFTEK